MLICLIKRTWFVENINLITTIVRSILPIKYFRTLGRTNNSINCYNLVGNYNEMFNVVPTVVVL